MQKSLQRDVSVKRKQIDVESDYCEQTFQSYGGWEWVGMGEP